LTLERQYLRSTARAAERVLKFLFGGGKNGFVLLKMPPFDMHFKR